MTFSVLHVISGLGQGGAEGMLIRLLNAHLHTFNQSVISLSDEGIHGAAVRALGLPLYTCRFRGSVGDVTSFIALDEAIRRSKPDLIQTWMVHADLIAGGLARMTTKAPVVWNLRNSNPGVINRKPLTTLAYGMSAFLSRHVPTCIVCGSYSAQSEYSKAGYDHKRMRVIPNGYDLSNLKRDPEWRLKMRTRYGIGPEVPVIGMVGRYHPMKDYPTLVAGAKLLLEKRQDAVFVLAGRGLEDGNAELMAKIKAAGVARAFRLIGQCTEVPQLFNCMDLATLTSNSEEGFPNVVAEAMACEIPCVVTDVGDAAMIVGDNGVVVTPSQPHRLAQEWLRMIELPKEARIDIGKRARASILNRFGIDVIAGKYAALYHELIEHVRHRRGH